MRSFTVDVSSGTYPVYIGPNLHTSVNEYLAKIGIKSDRKLMIVTDSNVAPLYASFLKHNLLHAGFTVTQVIIPAGEESKSLGVYQKIVTAAINAGLDRDSVILALGGGVVGDLAGFVAATYMRGIPYVQLPTTLLAHDSCIGGKVGVNFGGKNKLGSFYHPILVLLDTDSLQSLSTLDIRTGFVEMIKHAFIDSDDFVNYLEEHAQTLLALDRELLPEAIYRSCQVKKHIVEQDEKENNNINIRAQLNFGHTFGHALEALSGYSYSHGEAVSIGMVIAAHLSHKLLNLPMKTVRRLEKLLHLFQLPVRLSSKHDEKKYLHLMKQDKKSKNDSFMFVLISDIGKLKLVIVEEPLILETLQAIKL